ncbi:hypothetical protein [Acidisphaera rubrifaciens]|uniref:Uncharacterized protein n=1 Tax=Acidisphaera rubrifaciens HS-AP3 TaxID=1231350 RepID=A0A0D6P4U1_9PROT|nr:hypothetical protein [Acidisphaera rubrifaciens]GAN76361.1 hypothetical protein Asru_0086_37 [Acidisphaera rubrifaciens HS-AP3]
MTTQLIVVRPFGGLARGAAVTDPAKIRAILAGEHALDVVCVTAGTDRVAAGAPKSEGVR